MYVHICIYMYSYIYIYIFINLFIMCCFGDAPRRRPATGGVSSTVWPLLESYK